MNPLQQGLKPDPLDNPFGIPSVAIMNPLQQGLKHLTPSSNAGYKLSCNNESTTTRIETHIPVYWLCYPTCCNNESTTTRIETYLPCVFHQF